MHLLNYVEIVKLQSRHKATRSHSPMEGQSRGASFPMLRFEMDQARERSHQRHYNLPTHTHIQINKANSEALGRRREEEPLP
jgi:hypothetical protein